MGVIKVICSLLWDSLVDLTVYFIDLILIIYLSLGRVFWKISTEEEKCRVRRQIIERITNLENQQDDQNELALKILRDYYRFIKEN